ncbi:MAG: hypothetical protein WKF58_10780 [Ilumatobacteraceae bacterium]
MLRDVGRRTEGVVDRQDRVADELAGSVVRDVAATVDGDELGTDGGRLAPQVRRQVGAAPVREDVRMLQQQQVVLAPVAEQRRLHRQRLPIRHPPQPSHPQHLRSARHML